jgi:hypothetical protein
MVKVLVIVDVIELFVIGEGVVHMFVGVADVCYGPVLEGLGETVAHAFLEHIQQLLKLFLYLVIGSFIQYVQFYQFLQVADLVVQHPLVAIFFFELLVVPALPIIIAGVIVGRNRSGGL